MKTHLHIDQRLNGSVITNSDGMAIVELATISEMVADERGLIHGGFIFSAADYAAMVAVNHPNVVVSGANVRFIKPTVEGDILIFHAKVVENKEDRKFKVECHAQNQADVRVFEGIFECIVLSKHVLD